MSPRKPTIEDLDDVDDKDGTVGQDAPRPLDLQLHIRRADEVALGGATPPDPDPADERDEG
jgi:hypothetical protein